MKRGGPKNIVASVNARLVQRSHDLNVEHQLILNNELYIGRMVWNRLRYVKNPDTGKVVGARSD